MTHRDLAALQLALYAGDAGQYDYICDGSTDDDVVYGIAKRGDLTVVVLRGSITFEDWWRDFQAFPHASVSHPQLGQVHAGFFAGMEATWAEISSKVTGPWVVIGHSLGAARATILAGLAASSGRAPVARIVWGEPLCCFDRGAFYIRQIPGTSYINRHSTIPQVHDPVPDLPPPIGYTRVTLMTGICCQPRNPLILKDWHAMSLYAQATPEKQVNS